MPQIKTRRGYSNCLVRFVFFNINTYHFIMRLFWLALFFLFLVRIFFFLDQMNTPALPDEMTNIPCVRLLIADPLKNPLLLCSDAVVPLFNFFPSFITYVLINHFYNISILTCLRLVTFIVSCGVIYTCSLLLRQRYKPLVAILTLLSLGTNPALMQFSIFNWVNMNLVFLTLLASIIFQRLVNKNGLKWVILFSLVIVLIFQSYVMGKIIAFGLFLVCFFELKKTNQKLVFIGITAILLVPIIISNFMNTTLALDRTRTITLSIREIFDMNFFLHQIIPTVAGILGVPYAVKAGPDNPLFTPPALGLLPFFYTPFVIIGFLFYGRRAILYARKNTIPASYPFWIVIFIITIATNLLTVYPLNISRSMLLIPLYTFLIAKGVQIITTYKVFKNKKASFVLIATFILTAGFSIGIYYDWLHKEFHQYLFSILR